MENLTTSAVLKDKLSSVASDLASKATTAVQSLGSNKPTEENPISYKVVHRGGALVRSGFETTSGQVHQLAAGEVVTVCELIGRRARIVTPVDGWISIETKDGVQIMKQCALQRRSQQNEAFQDAFERKFAKMKDKQNRSNLDPRAERSESNSPSPRDRRWNDEDRKEDRYRDDRREAYDPPPKGSKRRDERRRDDSYDRYDRRRDDSRDRDHRDSRRGRDRDPSPRNDNKKEEKFVPKLAAPGAKDTNAPVPKLSGPGFAQPQSTFPQSAPPPAQQSGGLDLLDMDTPSTTSTQPNIDLFTSATPSTTPVLPVTGNSSPQQQAADQWNAFQAPSPPAQQQAQQFQQQNYMNTFGAQQGNMQPQAQNFMGNQMQTGGFAGAQPGWGAMGQQAPMGMQGANFGMQPGMQPGFPMGQNPMAPQAGYGAAFGGGMMGGMPGNMPMQQQQQQQQWGAFNAATAPSGGGTMPGVGTMPFSGSTAPGGNGNSIDDLLSKTMDGVANLSLEQRKQQMGQQGMPMQPMNMMQNQPRGW